MEHNFDNLKGVSVDNELEGQDLQGVCKGTSNAKALSAPSFC